MKTPAPQPSETPVALYRTEDGTVRVSALVQDETLWLTQAAMATLFDVAPQNITYHLKQIYESDELREGATCKEILQVQKEGGRKVSRTLKHYNLDAIIAVGYRVNSRRATQFRIWATKSVNEFIAFRRYQVLPDNARGKVARVDAEARALGEYEIFNLTQRIDSDFDKLVRASSHPAT